MAKTIWKTQYSNTGERFYTEAGTPVVKKYSSKVNEKGDTIVYEDGEEDLYSYIQSFADSTNIINIVKRFVNGDVSVLETRQGEFMDLTQIPDNYFDMVNSMRRGEELFNQLDPEIKAKFGQDPTKFLSTIGTDEWINNLGLKSTIKEPSLPAAESEVNE